MIESTISLPVVVVMAVLAGIGVGLGIYLQVARRRLVRLHGEPEVPADIAALQTGLRARHFAIELADFRFVEQRGANRVYRRSYAERNGDWLLKVEVKEGDVRAFEAEYRSRASWVLNRVISDGIGGHRILLQTD